MRIRHNSSRFLVILFLIISNLAVFYQVGNHDFVNYDDDYVTENRHVRAGWNIKSLNWAFTTKLHKKWNPLTWLSHMTDCQIFGLNPGPHHLTSLFFHIANTLLLFIILDRMTGALFRSAFVAALFALHPLHVESVAWVADRKDVLSTFFWMLTMGAYVRYVEHPRPMRYLFVAIFFVLGLMSKPMLVTLPFVLILLDCWPLGCMRHLRSDRTYASQSQLFTPIRNQRGSLLRLIGEKLPFFVLVGALIIIIIHIIEPWRGGESINSLTMNFRFANALISYVSYMGKMIWPFHLAVFYPINNLSPPILQAMGAGLLLICISFFIIWASKRHPYLALGWLWYLGTLVPVIGLIPGGPSTMADRYTYVPLIGLFIIIAWGVPEILKRWRYQRIALTITGGLSILTLMFYSWSQVQYWRDSITLFEHALDVTTYNQIAHNNLGKSMAKQGKIRDAVDHFQEALRISPDFPEANNNMGLAYALEGKFDQAISYYKKALAIQPDYMDAHYNLGLSLNALNRTEEAIAHFIETLRIRPDFIDAHNRLGIIFTGQGNPEKAIYHFTEALRLDPDLAEVHNNLGVALAQQGNFRKAIHHFEEALMIRPGYLKAQDNLELALKKLKE